jgi:hypothetical protein
VGLHPEDYRFLGSRINITSPTIVIGQNLQMFGIRIAYYEVLSIHSPAVVKLSMKNGAEARKQKLIKNIS